MPMAGALEARARRAGDVVHIEHRPDLAGIAKAHEVLVQLAVAIGGGRSLKISPNRGPRSGCLPSRKLPS